MNELVEELVSKKTGIDFENLVAHFKGQEPHAAIVSNIANIAREFCEVSEDIRWKAEQVRERVLNLEYTPNRLTLNIDEAIGRRYELWRSLENHLDILRWAMRASEA